MGSLPRFEAALRQSGVRRIRDADHRHQYAAIADGLRNLSYRSSDATIFSVVEGTGSSQVGDETFTWSKRDTFVVPGWVPVKHSADEDAVLFSFSDRPVQRMVGLWREDRGNA